MLNPAAPLSAMIETLAGLPLVFHAGTAWEYSVATDVLGRLVEILSGQRFDAFIQSRILDRLGMMDTAFVVSVEKRHRFTAYYAGADLLDPMKPGLTRIDDAPYPGAYLSSIPRLSGGGGLVSTLPDMVALLRSLLPGGTCIPFPPLGEIPGKAFGLAGALTLVPSSLEPEGAAGEFHLGGIAGTHWWISPKANLAGLSMTQRQMAFWHPFSFEFKRPVYQAVGGGANASNV